MAKSSFILINLIFAQFISKLNVRFFLSFLNLGADGLVTTLVRGKQT